MKHARRSRAERRDEAEARAAARSRRTIQQQIMEVASRPGDSAREMSRLREQLVKLDSAERATAAKRGN